MAYFRKLPSGKWRAQVEINGVRDSASFLTKKEAENWADVREADLRAGRDKPARDVTVRQLLELYAPIAEKADSGRWNKIRLDKWINGKDVLMDMALPAIVTHDLNEWMHRRQQDTYRGEPISPGTVRREFNLLSSAFAYAVQSKRWIPVSPCHGAQRPPQGPPRARPLLTPAEIKAIAVASGFESDAALSTKTARVGATFFLALETGARSGELLRVKPEHYWRARRTLYIAALEKGGRKGAKSGQVAASRQVPLTARAMELLDRLVATMPADQPYIVGVNDSTRDTLWRKARDRSGVEDLTFHDLKHEACTRLSKFIDVIALSHAVGTKDVRLLRDTYYNNDAERNAALLPAQLSLKIEDQDAEDSAALLP